jgi:hypothetical protein
MAVDVSYSVLCVSELLTVQNSGQNFEWLVACVGTLVAQSAQCEVVVGTDWQLNGI